MKAKGSALSLSLSCAQEHTHIDIGVAFAIAVINFEANFLSRLFLHQRDKHWLMNMASGSLRL